MSRRYIVSVVVAGMAMTGASSSALASSKADSAQACVAKTAPGKDRGTCVNRAARSTMAISAASAGVVSYPDGDGGTFNYKTWDVTGTGFNPGQWYTVAAYSGSEIVDSGEGMLNLQVATADADGNIVWPTLYVNDYNCPDGSAVTFGASDFSVWPPPILASTTGTC